PTPEAEGGSWIYEISADGSGLEEVDAATEAECHIETVGSTSYVGSVGGLSALDADGVVVDELDVDLCCGLIAGGRGVVAVNLRAGQTDQVVSVAPGGDVDVIADLPDPLGGISDPIVTSFAVTDHGVVVSVVSEDPLDGSGAALLQFPKLR